MNYIVTSKEFLSLKSKNNLIYVTGMDSYSELNEAIAYAMEAYKAYKKINVLILGYEEKDLIETDYIGLHNDVFIATDKVKIYDEEQIKALSLLI